MSTIYYKTAQNYFDPRKVESIHVPQPFLNYGGLTKMLNDDYRYNPKDSSDIVYSQPQGKSDLTLDVKSLPESFIVTDLR